MYSCSCPQALMHPMLHVGGVGGNASGDFAMAGTEVSVGMLWTSPLSPRVEALVPLEAQCDMFGTNRLVGLHLYNNNVAFRGVGGGLVPFIVASSHNYHLSSKTTYTTK